MGTKHLSQHTTKNYWFRYLLFYMGTKHCKLETGIDIDYIKENYSVEDINSNGVLFVDKCHSHDFGVWKLL